jgi:phage tail-like protein
MSEPRVYPGFNFTVEFDGAEVARFTEVSGLDFEIEPIEYRTGSERTPELRKIPGLRKYGNVVLKHGITSSDEFWSWIIAALDDPVELRNGTVSLLNEEHEPVAQWRFRNGWPCKYQGPHMKATANEIAIETVEICHEGLVFERP